MGHPAQEEGQDSCSKHAQYLVIPGTGAFLDVSRPQQRPSDEAVTGDDDDEGHQEAQQAFHQADGQQELLQPHGVFNVRVQNGTHCSVRVCDVVDVPGQCCGHTKHKGKKPDHYAGDTRVHDSAEPAWSHWVDDGEVTVNAERREEKDAGVEVKNHQPCTGLAQESSKGPVVAWGGEGGPHGQSDEEGEVRNSKIEHKNIGHRLELHVAVDDSHYHAVPDDADDKVTAVDDGYQGEDEFMASRHAACQSYPFCRSCRYILHFPFLVPDPGTFKQGALSAGCVCGDWYRPWARASASPIKETQQKCHRQSRGRAIITAGMVHKR